jgi:hypothetical protein
LEKKIKKTHILCLVNFLTCRLRDNVEKKVKEGQATDDNMSHAHFINHHIMISKQQPKYYDESIWY